MTQSTPTLSQLRQQLQQLKELVDAGTISAAAYEESRVQLEKRVLDLVMSGAEVSGVAPVAEVVSPALAKARPSWKLLATGAVVMLAIGSVGYLWKGHPETMGGTTPAAPMAAQGEGDGGRGGEGGDHAIGNEQFQAMVAKLADRLKKQPNDAEGWAMLGRSYNVLGRLDEALEAYRKSYAINPNDPSLLADLADAVAIRNNRSLAGEPMKLARRALEIDPKHVKALALVGTEAFERKDYAGAVKLWERAVAAAPADSDMAQQLQGGIVEARKLGNLGPAPALQTPQTQAGVGQAVEALAGRDVRGTVSLAAALVAKASPDDTVFIFARPADGSRMPLAILRKQVRDLPFDFTLDDSLSMSPAARLSQASKVIVSARVSKSGQAMPQPGDLNGQTGPIDVGSRGLRIEIAEVLK